jgi:hypothetical protein
MSTNTKKQVGVKNLFINLYQTLSTAISPKDFSGLSQRLQITQKQDLKKS